MSHDLNKNWPYFLPAVDCNTLPCLLDTRQILLCRFCPAKMMMRMMTMIRCLINRVVIAVSAQEQSIAAYRWPPHSNGSKTMLQALKLLYKGTITIWPEEWMNMNMSIWIWVVLVTWGLMIRKSGHLSQNCLKWLISKPTHLQKHHRTYTSALWYWY